MRTLCTVTPCHYYLGCDLTHNVECGKANNGIKKKYGKILKFACKNEWNPVITWLVQITAN